MVQHRGAAIVETPYGILLVRENESGNYALPGGTKRRDESTVQATLRELNEELGLDAVKYRHLFNIPPNKRARHPRKHYVHLVHASGEIDLQNSEIEGIGFFAGCPGTRIPNDYLEGHVHAMKALYIDSKKRPKVAHAYFCNPTIDSKLLSDWRKDLKAKRASVGWK